MTIKPVVTQKSGEKKETHGHQDSQNQNLVVSNVRNNHRNAVLNNKSNTEGQSPQRRGDVYEDITRHRRSPHKSNIRKREQREREKLSASPKYHLLSASSPNTTSSCSGSISPIPDSPPQLKTSINNASGIIEEHFSGYNSGDEHLIPKEKLVTLDEWKNRDDDFVKAMSERGYVIQNIAEDGACLFRAISLQIFGDQEMHEVIRQQTMDYIYENREYFSQFVTEDINTYVERKRSKDSHGNHIEIQAISEIYNRPVELYCYKTTPINIFNSKETHNRHNPLRLSYQRGSHYNAIIDPYNASVGVGLGLPGYKPESQTHEAIRLSEELQIEQTMFEDKLKTTDWEATNEAIEEQIARESYLQWCRENMRNAAKVSTHGTSSTVTSAEAQTTSCSTSYDDTNSKEMQFRKSCDEQLLEEATIIPVTQGDISTESLPDFCCESDDTDISNSSTVDLYNGKVKRYKSRGKFSRIQKRRRTAEIKLSSSSSDAFTEPYEPKRLKQNHYDDIAEHYEHYKPTKIQPNQSTHYLPCTSKQAEEKKPVSKFYQSLLESYYAEDGLVQLSETEMVQRAIQQSRIDFIEDQRLKYGEKNYMDVGDDDSDPQ